MLSTDPIKLLKRVSDVLVGEKLLPYHVSLCPTNQCNLSCDHCMCGNRDELLELDLDSIKHIVTYLGRRGCKAVTITGGGEPLMHPNIGEVIELIAKKWITVGIETNGTLLGSVGKWFRKLDWCSVSVSDDTNITSLFEVAGDASDKYHDVDWMFNYIVTRNFDHLQLAKVLRFAEAQGFARISVVSDLRDLANVPNMYDVRQYMVEEGVPVDKVTFHGYRMYTNGARRCLVSLIKPVIAADGQVYPCIGSCCDQGDFTQPISPGIVQLYDDQPEFNGSGCARCYYGRHNALLEDVVSSSPYEEFI